MTTYTDRNGVDWDPDHFGGSLVRSLYADLRDALTDRTRLANDLAAATSVALERSATIDTHRRWKLEATTVLNRWDAVAELFPGAPLGGLVSDWVRSSAADLIAERDRLNNLLTAERRRNRELDEALSDAEHRLTLVADARGHGLA